MTPSKESSQFLSRNRRYLTDTIDDLEVDCVESSCTKDELEEIFDFETGLFKVIWLRGEAS